MPMPPEVAAAPTALEEDEPADAETADAKAGTAIFFNIKSGTTKSTRMIKNNC